MRTGKKERRNGAKKRYVGGREGKKKVGGKKEVKGKNRKWRRERMSQRRARERRKEKAETMEGRKRYNLGE